MYVVLYIKIKTTFYLRGALIEKRYMGAFNGTEVFNRTSLLLLEVLLNSLKIDWRCLGGEIFSTESVSKLMLIFFACMKNCWSVRLPKGKIHSLHEMQNQGRFFPFKSS